ncbi:calcium-binding protein [Amedibacillus sp. YH-ame6]
MITIISTKKKIILKEYYYGGEVKVFKMEFSDATIWDTEEVSCRFIQESTDKEGDFSFNDYIRGSNGNDILDGGIGDDKI